jgi:F-type H+-transporting ATPase subunit delta
MAKLVSQTYGNALFELAKEEDSIDTMLEEVKAVRQIYEENTELVQLLNHPKITREEKKTVVETVFKGRISDHLTGFLVLLIEKDRYNDMNAVFEYFIKQVYEYKNIGVVYVSSAKPLSKEQEKAVEERLLQVTKYVAFEMHFDVEPDLIGGMVIRIGDRVVDSSIRTKLANMQKELLKLQLA